VATTATEKRIAEFIGKYSPEMAADIKACRRKVRAWMPRGFELVYDSHNALVFGFSASERGSEAVISIAGYPRWVTLFFLRGTELEDPHSLLEGSGKQVRGITLESPKQLDDPQVRALIARALAPERERLATAPKLTTQIKAVAANQRPRRSADAPTKALKAPKKREAAKLNPRA
jgi:hypothetical protein